MPNEHTYDYPEGNEGKYVAKDLLRNHKSLKMIITKCLIVVTVFSVLFGFVVLVTVVTFKTEEGKDF